MKVFLRHSIFLVRYSAVFIVDCAIQIKSFNTITGKEYLLNEP
jgi:hypothetical protein